MEIISPGTSPRRIEFDPRPEPSKEDMLKVKSGELEACNCKTYPAWYCNTWPRCVSI